MKWGEVVNNYTVTHLHTELSNGVTNIDSITKFQDYIDRAIELGMTAIAFTEHGNIFRHVKKRQYCQKNGIKYIHGVEIYLTETLEEKIRDNYHCCLYAKNLEGFKELNKLLSHEVAFNREDNHFYYTPRISIDELMSTSDNIIITTACLGGVLNGGGDSLKKRFIDFLINNKHRCFLEIQHHNVSDQIKYNRYLFDLHQQTNIPLIAGTDTHALNNIHLKGRSILQKAKNIHFDNEDGWDLTFKSYNELVEIYMEQYNPFEMTLIYKAINNTNVLASMIDDYELDDTPKFPQLYSNPMEVFKQKINEGVIKRGIMNYDNYKTEYLPRIYEELDVYEKCNAINYMLLMDKILTDARREANVRPGFGRGSVNGSLIAYLMGITEMDSIKWDLLFFRFMNPHRISLPDIDTDFGDVDRDWIMDYLFRMDNIHASLIITFNTVALKGSIRDVGRALGMSLEIVDDICKNITDDNIDDYREQYKELFEYVDIINGTIVSIGSHPAGVVVAPMSIKENLGTCTLKDNDKPVTMVDMKEVDGLNWIKLDILGLDTIGVINETCDLVGIKRITPDDVNIYDDKVWNDIILDTTNIFQMESDMAHQYLEKIMSEESMKNIQKKYPYIKKFDLFQLVCSMIRPGGANMRDDASMGICRENGIKELDDMLEDTMGYILLQEQIMQFLTKFCNYTEAESDSVRRAIGKKTGTEQLLPEIEQRFMEYAPKQFGLSLDVANNVIKNAIQTILDCSNYSFSKNHNYPYSFTGYIAGYLRHYYPLEFGTACLNTWTRKKKSDKINDTTRYINSIDIKIKPPKFRYSKAEYFMDKETNSIYKGIESIKYLNSEVAESLYSLKDNQYNSFLDLLIDIHEKGIKINSRQMSILISIDFFSEFGKSQKLFDILEIFDTIYMKQQNSKQGLVTFNKKKEMKYSVDIISKFAEKETDNQIKVAKAYELCNYLINNEIKNFEMPSIDKVITYFSTMGTCDYIFEDYMSSMCVVVDIITKYKVKRALLYNIASGKTIEVRIGEGIYELQQFKQYDVVNLLHLFQKQKKKQMEVEVEDKNGNVSIKKKWMPTGEFELYVDEYHWLDSDEVEELNRQEREYRESLM